MSDIHALCSWRKADTGETLARLGLGKLFAKHGIGKNAEDLFGEVPATYIHAGDVHHRGPVSCDAQGHGIFVIEGSLAIDGAFTFFTADAYTILVITGDLSAAHLHQAWDTQLVVLGTTTIAGLLFIDVSDAGFALFRGPVSSRDRVVSSEVTGGVAMFAKKPKGTARELTADPIELHERLVRGDELFAAPAPAPAKAKKPPAAAALAKMSVAEVLGVTGFEDMQIQDAKINPQWFRKGKPGCALASLSLLAETYVDAFPPTLKSLTLLNQADAARTEAMLRVLPASLARLRISGTALARIPAEIAALSALEELELQGNESLTSLPRELGALPLRRVMITGNAIAKLDLDLDRIAEVIVDEPARQLRKQPARA